MNSLLAPGPWHVTAEDHVVRDVNGAPIAIVLARHPRAHADVIADLPNAARRHDASRDAVISELREKLAVYEGIEKELDDLREELADARVIIGAMAQGLKESQEF